LRLAVVGCGRVGVEGVEVAIADAASLDELSRALRGVDVVCEALPSRLSFKALRSIVGLGLDVASTSYMPEDPLELDGDARRAGRTVVVDCGVAPGISNLAAGRASSLMDELAELSILVGGMPSTPNVPLRHAASWCLHDLIEEYTRRPRIVVEGRVVEVDPLSGYEVVEVPGVGVFECFYTDGLRTMIRNIRARRMYEKTLRHRGHVEAVKALASIGMLSDEEVDGVRPRELLAKLLSRAWRGVEEDLLVLLVRAMGVKGGVKVKASYRLVDQGSPPPLLKATASMCLAVAAALAKGEVVGPGVMAPEQLGMDEAAYLKLTSRLRDLGVCLEESVEVGGP